MISTTHCNARLYPPLVQGLLDSIIGSSPLNSICLLATCLLPSCFPHTSLPAQIGTHALALALQIAKGYKYVYTIDDDCFVAKDPTGEDINALEQHIRNLLTPSTPYFFNTLYDPYAPGADFVRGYPFSMREGVPTAVSHGNAPGCCSGLHGVRRVAA